MSVSSGQDPPAHRLRSVSGVGAPSGAPGYPGGYRNVPRATLRPGRAVRWAIGIIVGLAAAWLLAARPVLGYRTPDGGPDAWSDPLAAIVLLLVAVAFAAGILKAAWFGLATVMLGLWLIAAPFALRYGGPAVATANDVIVGIVLVLVGSIGWLKYGRAG
jgi:hypothetical protein